MANSGPGYYHTGRNTPKWSLSFVLIVKCPPPMASPSKNVRDNITRSQDISNKLLL